jgi:hypothetical protein
LRQLGAENCFDYNNTEVTMKIREAKGRSLRYAAYCMSEVEKLGLVNGCIGDERDVISAILGGTSEGGYLKKNVTVKVSMLSNLLGW